MKKAVLLFLFPFALSISGCNFMIPRRNPTNIDSGDQSSIDNDESNIDEGESPSIDLNNQKVTFGLYPQIKINDTDLIDSLSKKAVSISNDWYKYNDEYYAKAIGQLTDTKDTGGWSKYFSDDEEIVVGKTYWFKCMPIIWNIFKEEDDRYILMTERIIDVTIFDETSNNYQQSRVREWLNNDFYNAAFLNSNKSYILTSEVDNSASQTDADSASLACENTYDKVYLPSYQDTGGDANVRGKGGYPTVSEYLAVLTDYAFCKGAYKIPSNSSGFYWLRSPSSANNNDQAVVDAWYNLHGQNWNWDINVHDIGVRPMIAIKK